MELLNNITKAIILCCGWNKDDLLECGNKDTLLGRKILVYVARDYSVEITDIAKFIGCEASQAIQYYKEAVAEFEGNEENVFLGELIAAVVEVALNSSFYDGVSLETDGEDIILTDAKHNVSARGTGILQVLHLLRAEVFSKYENITDESLLERDYLEGHDSGDAYWIMPVKAHVLLCPAQKYISNCRTALLAELGNY